LERLRTELQANQRNYDAARAAYESAVAQRDATAPGTPQRAQAEAVVTTTLAALTRADTALSRSITQVQQQQQRLQALIAAPIND